MQKKCGTAFDAHATVAPRWTHFGRWLRLSRLCNPEPAAPGKLKRLLAANFSFARLQVVLARVCSSSFLSLTHHSTLLQAQNFEAPAYPSMPKRPADLLQSTGCKRGFNYEKQARAMRISIEEWKTKETTATAELAGTSEDIENTDRILIAIIETTRIEQHMDIVQHDSFQGFSMDALFYMTCYLDVF